MGIRTTDRAPRVTCRCGAVCRCSVGAKVPPPARSDARVSTPAFVSARASEPPASSWLLFAA